MAYFTSFFTAASDSALSASRNPAASPSLTGTPAFAVFFAFAIFSVFHVPGSLFSHTFQLISVEVLKIDLLRRLQRFGKGIVFFCADFIDGMDSLQNCLILR